MRTTTAATFAERIEVRNVRFDLSAVPADWHGALKFGGAFCKANAIVSPARRSADGLENVIEIRWGR